jgi:uncharacterized membrane protein
MITVIVLIIVFILSIFIQKFFFKRINLALAGRIAMSVMLIFTGFGHFKFTQGMSMMLPPIIPLKREMILITGFIEILAAITLLIPRWQKLTSICLIIFFLGILPANIYAALHHVNLQTASYDGKGPEYLWIRIPMQLFFIAWVWYFGLRRNGKSLHPIHESKGDPNS